MKGRTYLWFLVAVLWIMACSMPVKVAVGAPQGAVATTDTTTTETTTTDTTTTESTSTDTTTTETSTTTSTTESPSPSPTVTSTTETTSAETTSTTDTTPTETSTTTETTTETPTATDTTTTTDTTTSTETTTTETTSTETTSTTETTTDTTSTTETTTETTSTTETPTETTSTTETPTESPTSESTTSSDTTSSESTSSDTSTTQTTTSSTETTTTSAGPEATTVATTTATSEEATTSASDTTIETTSSSQEATTTETPAESSSTEAPSTTEESTTAGDTSTTEEPTPTATILILSTEVPSEGGDNATATDQGAEDVQALGIPVDPQVQEAIQQCQDAVAYQFANEPCLSDALQQIEKINNTTDDQEVPDELKKLFTQVCSDECNDPINSAIKNLTESCAGVGVYAAQTGSNQTVSSAAIPVAVQLFEDVAIFNKDVVCMKNPDNDTELCINQQIDLMSEPSVTDKFKTAVTTFAEQINSTIQDGAPIFNTTSTEGDNGTTTRTIMIHSNGSDTTVTTTSNRTVRLANDTAERAHKVFNHTVAPIITTLQHHKHDKVCTQCLQVWSSQIGAYVRARVIPVELALQREAEANATRVQLERYVSAVDAKCGEGFVDQSAPLTLGRRPLAANDTSPASQFSKRSTTQRYHPRRAHGYYY